MAMTSSNNPNPDAHLKLTALIKDSYQLPTYTRTLQSQPKRLPALRLDLSNHHHTLQSL